MARNTKSEAPATKEVKDPLEGDFTIYQEKPPTELHELHAALIQELTGVEITAKQVQVVLGMHGKIQASEANRKRAGYKPRTAESIRKGGATTVEHFDQILAEVAPKPAPKPRAPRKTAAQKKAEAEAAKQADTTAEVAVAS